ncbi:hypothetical protein ACWGJV_38420 [Streptomyces tendae]
MRSWQRVGSPSGFGGRGRRMPYGGAVAAGVLVLLVAWNFVYFFPVHTAQKVPYPGWHARMWLDTWI